MITLGEYQTRTVPKRSLPYSPTIWHLCCAMVSMRTTIKTDHSIKYLFTSANTATTKMLMIRETNKAIAITKTGKHIWHDPTSVLLKSILK